MTDFFDEICPTHQIPWGECMVKHLRVPPEEAIRLLQERIDEGEAIRQEMEKEVDQ